MVARPIAQNLREVTSGTGHPLRPEPPAQNTAIPQQQLSGVGQLYRRTRREACRHRPQELDVCRLPTWREFHGHRLHPDRNRQAEQGRSAGMANMGSGKYRRSQNQQARRTDAKELQSGSVGGVRLLSLVIKARSCVVSNTHPCFQYTSIAPSRATHAPRVRALKVYEKPKRTLLLIPFYNMGLGFLGHCCEIRYQHFLSLQREASLT